MKESIIRDKSFQFSLKIIKFYKNLIYNKKEYVIGKQLLRSGTSIGANTEEALGAQSRKEFKSKLSIAYKEARETNYWIKLLRDSQIVTNKEIIILKKDINEIIKILASILTTLNNS